MLNDEDYLTEAMERVEGKKRHAEALARDFIRRAKKIAASEFSDASTSDVIAIANVISREHSNDYLFDALGDVQTAIEMNCGGA